MAISTEPVHGLKEVKLEYTPNTYPVPANASLPRMFFVALFVGSRGSGKTYSCCQLLKMYETHGIKNMKGKDMMQRVILISPTSAANPVFECLKHLDHARDVVENYSDSKLLEVLADIKAEKEATAEYKVKMKVWRKFKRCKHPEELQYEELMQLHLSHFQPPEPPRFPDGVVNCLVLDDLVGSSAFKATGKSALTNLCLKNRHLQINIMICTQNLKAIPKSIRTNTSLFVIFRFASEKVICEDLYEEVSNSLKLPQFCELYEFATRDDHDALIMDFSQPKDMRFKMNWRTVIRLAADGRHAPPLQGAH